MTTIAANLQAVRARIDAACQQAGRSRSEVRLLAVSKTWPARCIRAALAAGQQAFGENYLQECLEKQVELTNCGIEWHFIGPLQSNKTKAVAENFAWVHSVERLKIAERLSAQRPAHLPPLQVCVQVNISGESSKSGCVLEEAPLLLRAVANLPNLQLRGLMAIPQSTEDISRQREQFGLLRQLRDELMAQGLPLDTLSMGMSHDLEAAIMEGATLVRVGTAIFGERQILG